MLCGGRQRFRINVVESDSDGFRRLPVDVDTQVNGDRAVRHEVLEGRPDPALRNQRRTKTARDLSNLLDHRSNVSFDLGEADGKCVLLGRNRRLQRRNLLAELEQRILGELAEASLDPLASFVARTKEAGA